MFSTLMPMPSASTTIALAGQDVSTWFAQIQPVMVVLGVPIAVIVLGIIVAVLIKGFHMLQGMFSGGNYGDDEYNGMHKVQGKNGWFYK